MQSHCFLTTCYKNSFLFCLGVWELPTPVPVPSPPSLPPAPATPPPRHQWLT